MKKHIIYNSEVSREDALESIAFNLDEGERIEDVSDERIWEEQAFLSELYYGDEKANLNKTLDGRVLCIADLGLWNGRKSGYKMMGYNLNEVINAAVGDAYEVYSDGRNVVARDAHHDGTNYYTFREVKAGVNIDNLLCKIYDGTATTADISRYTRSLVPYVNEIYGWGKQKRKAERKAEPISISEAA